ncbi:hypothetical protein ABVK25_000224 [Lepraria finkii]|uniref:Uncharacterized protein n=1 Tax=Lepraria finkii TaxID=1340010 RepID=A0ABR4BMA2_9LECA
MGKPGLLPLRCMPQLPDITPHPKAIETMIVFGSLFLKPYSPSLFYRIGATFTAALYDGYSVELLVNKFNNQNSSWCFLALAKVGGDQNAAFRASMLKFDKSRTLQW